MTAFWKHLPRAMIDAYSLRLAHDTMFLSDPDLGNALYVRDDYRSMLATVEKQFATRRTRKLVISGNPGIGKSWFGLYFLHYLATTAPNTPIVWESIRKKRRFLFRDGSALRGDLSAFSDVLDNRDAWCEECLACFVITEHNAVHTSTGSSSMTSNLVSRWSNPLQRCSCCPLQSVTTTRMC